MANFLDHKEEVLKVELTKHGRKMLGMGIFNPHYCSFFDNGVIYDNSYTGYSSEDVNAIQDRILYNSMTVGSLNNLEDTLSEPLGGSDIFKDYAPAWNINLLRGSMNYLTASSSYYKKTFEFSDLTVFKSLDKFTDSLSNSNVVSYELENGNYINIENDYILIDIEELNISGDAKNFEIEIEAFDQIFGGKDAGLERKLKFLQKQNNIIDGIIYDASELPFVSADQDINTNDAAYYFDILVDDEIDPQFIKAKEQTVREEVKGTYDSNFTGPVKEDC